MGAFDNFVPPSEGSAFKNFKPPPNPFDEARQSDIDKLRILSDALTSGYWNRLVDTVTGSNQAQKASEAWSRQGLLGGVIPAAIGYYNSPVGILGRAVSGVPSVASSIWNRLGAGAGEGALAAVTSDVGHGQKPGLDVPISAVVGAVPSAVFGPKMRIDPTKVPGTASLQKTADNAVADASKVRFRYPDVQAVARAANTDALRRGMTEIGNKPAYRLLNSGTNANPSFTEYAYNPQGPITVKDILDFQDKARALTDKNTQYGSVLSERLDDLLENATPLSNTMESPNAAAQAVRNSQKKLARSIEIDSQVPKDPVIEKGAAGKVAGYLGSHSYGIGRYVLPPLIGMGVGYGGQEVGIPHALELGLAIGAGIPAVSKTASTINQQALARAILEARAANVGIQPTVRGGGASDALKALLFGGATGF